METEVLLRVCAILVAGGLLLSTVNYYNVWEKIKKVFSRKQKVVIEEDTGVSVSFLQIVESWHVLRNQCEEYGLKEAVEKIDEVFPLLNMEESDV
mgnify:CR=1 FL=1|jgi:hypothetical protein